MLWNTGSFLNLCGQLCLFNFVITRVILRINWILKNVVTWLLSIKQSFCHKERCCTSYDRLFSKNESSFCFLLTADYSTSEMLVNMGNLPLDEFYPAVAIVTLMRILRDPSLSNHHTMVVQAVTFIFKSLGLKCVQFLPQVMPTFLNVIRVCDASIREVVSK